MANYFEILRPVGMEAVALDSAGKSDVQFTIKNVSGIKQDGRITLVSIPASPTGPVESNWVKLEGAPQRSFEPNKSEAFVVKIAVPAKATPGSYSFRLDAALVERPDKGDRGQPVEIKVLAKNATPSKFKWWIPVSVVLALAFVAIVVYLVLPGKISVPDLRGETPTAAGTALQNAGLLLNPAPGSVNTTQQADVGKVVAQDPIANAKVSKGATVTISLGALQVVVPEVRNKSIADATAILNANGLLVHQPITYVQEPGSTGGYVLTQTPSVGTPAATNTEVALTVVKQMVPVPPVIGMDYNQAYAAISQANLSPVPMYRVSEAGTVQSQYPAAGALVNVGSPVNYRMPSAPPIWIPFKQTLSLQAGKFRLAH